VTLPPPGPEASATIDPAVSPKLPETAPAIGAVRPSDEVREELEQFLVSDGSRLGEVHRGLLRGLTADGIAAEMGVATSNFVWNYTKVIEALLLGDLPGAPTVALGTARKFRTLLATASLSAATRQYLQVNLAELERRAEDQTARVVEVQRAHEETERAESRNDVGIYAYALPHYLRYPYDAVSGRTLMKVGRSDSDVIRRFRDQVRTTALPEEPILLRIYRTEARSTADVERDFHRLLEAADHFRSVARSAGREWFVTSIRFLDEVARVMGLPIVVVNETTVDDDAV